MKCNSLLSNNSRLGIVTLFLTLFLAGCGGGGGSSGGDTTLPTAPVTITQQNAPQVAGAAIDSLGSSSNLPIGVQTSTQVPRTSLLSNAQTVAKIGQIATQKIISQAVVPAIVTGVTNPPVNCQFGGTITVAQTGPTSGSTTFSNCINVVGVKINGTVSVSNITQNGSYVSAVAVYNLSITTTSPANTLTASGDMYVTFNIYSLAPASMSGSYLSMNNSNSTIGNSAIQNYSFSFDSLGNISATTFTFASTAINGTAVFAMTSQFTFSGGRYPSSGVATISGADSTVLKLTVLGNEYASNQVQIELSTDGGVTYAAPTYHTWASISGYI